MDEGVAGVSDPDGHGDGLLPMFSADYLDKIPVYHHTHSIRLLIVQKCETTLSWDQLRSPQVSQFLVKPIQKHILSTYFSRATLYILIANCLQFKKEGQIYPANIGVSRTRAMMAELLAVRLLKEYSTHELIDALNYDFDPMQGFAQNSLAKAMPNTPRDGTSTVRPSLSARISTVEVAIRAEAKKFLAHPVVVQQLEAIWAGSIVFHSAADSLHRKPQKSTETQGGYGTFAGASASAPADPSLTRTDGQMQQRRKSKLKVTPLRRSVTLYNPRQTSLFKLSRLRVPRYRFIFSTASFALMLGLFLAVLIEKSVDISGLELVFCFWSAGYMLDELVSFTGQGFNLYIISFWNIFDLGIFMLFVVYYVLRLYSLLIPTNQRGYIAGMAYDVLAATAILLFPRLFSILDHYRYFSQLLIAFRMMSMDLMAILVLIVVACSGFFVAFTLSFGNQKFDAAGAAYTVFQIVMGFTPAAWQIWDDYNILGKAILVLFLFICHFLVVTILISVLTNSFMAVVQNANEEHQFLFAVNTISMVKSDALFSYIAPTNVLGWLLVPTGYVLPFTTFVKLNRTLIKISHMPILFFIFVYERLVLSSHIYDPAELVEQRHRSKATPFALNPGNGNLDLFSPGRRVREASVTTFRKDFTLNEVFRRPYGDSSTRRRKQHDEQDKRRSTQVVRNWMSLMGQEGGASPPLETPRHVLDKLEAVRPSARRLETEPKGPRRKHVVHLAPRSVASDPEERSHLENWPHAIPEEDYPDISLDGGPQPTDADGDDELLSNDDDDPADLTSARPAQTPSASNLLEETHGHSRAKGINEDEDDDDDDRTDAKDGYFRTLVAPQFRGVPYHVQSSSTARNFQFTSSPQAVASSPLLRHQPVPVPAHKRTISTNTILYSPLYENRQSSSASDDAIATGKVPGTDKSEASAALPPTDDIRTPIRPSPLLRHPATPAAATAIPPPRHTTNMAGPSGIGTILGLGTKGNALLPKVRARRNSPPSFSARALDLASDLGDNRYGPDPGSAVPFLPGSLGTQFVGFADARFRLPSASRPGMPLGQREGASTAKVNKLLLKRIGTLEESFRNIVREVKDWRKESSRGASATEDSAAGSGSGPGGPAHRKGRRAGRIKNTVGIGKRVLKKEGPRKTAGNLQQEKAASEHDEPYEHEIKTYEEDIGLVQSSSL